MDKTLDFDVNGTKVTVDALPKPIRDAVTLFDRMREDLADIAYQQNVLLIAVSSINAKIINDVQEFMDGPKVEDTAPDVNPDTPAETETDDE